MDPARFWHLTPRELHIETNAVRRRQTSDLRRAMYVGWHIAAFTRVKKRMPGLSSVLERVGNEPQTPEQMIARQLQQVRILNEFFGGVDKTKDRKE